MLIFNLLILLYLTRVNGDCVALATSKVCPAFSQFKIALPELAKDYPFLINITTIDAFDQRLLDYVNSTSAYLFPLGCLSSNFNKWIPYPRYSLTRLCAGVIQNSNSLPCNFDVDLTPPPLCKTTCFDWVESVAQITHNPRVCASSSQRNTTLDYYKEQCNTWQGYNGTVNDSCVSGIANEPYNCGFGNSSTLACRYCSNHPDDECCHLMNCSHALSGGAIAGIVVGCVGFVTLVLLAILYKIRKKQKLNPSTSSSSSTAVTKKEGQWRSMPSPFSDEFFVVVHPYTPQLTDEVGLHVGDIVCLAAEFDDGWGLGFNVTSGQKGAFPVVCISPAPNDSLDHLLNMDEPVETQVSITHRSGSLKSTTEDAGRKSHYTFL